jgi:EEF1A N-terminal glycine/lysine methyltransferase
LKVKLFAHFVWNAAILTADFISSGQFSVVGESVLELGAGTGLPGILAVLEGADLVVLSDYKSPKLLANLERNVTENIPAKLKDKVKVEGHIWGQDDSAITQYVLFSCLSLTHRHRKSFSRIIAADCYWMSDQHDALVWSLTHFLEKSSTARIFVVAGLHTGRSVISNFFRVAGSRGLLPDDSGIEEHNVFNGITRGWKEGRGMEDLVERKQWLIVTRLKWCLS